MNLSLPVRVVALGLLVVVLGSGAFALIALSHKGAAPPLVIKPAQLSHHSATARATTHTASRAHSAPRVVVDSTLPPTLRAALEQHRVAVAVLYAPNIAAEAGSVSAARDGAAAARAGFVAFDVRDEATAEALANRFPGLSDPMVLVLRRPGVVLLALDGVQDATTVYQAAVQAGA